MWREGFDNPVDYSDHGANCGTRSVSTRLSSGTSKACTENAYMSMYVFYCISTVYINALTWAIT